MATIKKRSEVRNTKLQKVAADLFLKHGYEGVSIDKIVEHAGGSKSTVYSEFGGKCGLFISSIAKLCRDSNEPLASIDYSGLNLEGSLKKLAFSILKLITARRLLELHRLAIAEAANCPEVGEAWYNHGPKRTASFIRAVLEQHREEFPHKSISMERLSVFLHDALTGDLLYRHLSGITKRESDEQLRQRAWGAVEIVLANLRASPAKSNTKARRTNS